MNPPRLLVLLVSLPLLLGGCGREKQVVDFDLIEEREGIRYLKDSDTPYTGKAISLYENGQKEHETNFEDGEVDGLSVYWYENGQKKLEVNYKDGEKISEKHWNEEGELIGEYPPKD